MDQLSEVIERKDWRPDSWRAYQIKQQPRYSDENALESTLKQLSSLPPLVTSWEVTRLKRYLTEVQQGKRFLIQGGDCAETFADCKPSIISNRLKVLLQMSLVITHGCKVPVLRIGRFAGQYAKPRSSDWETRDGVTLPCFRGDIVNASDFTKTARAPDPKRLLEAYYCSALTMNFIRALVEGGFADIRHPEYWDLDWVQHSPNEIKVQKLVEQINESIHFAEVLEGRKITNLSTAEFFSSHEALHLHYEQALTRRVPRHPGFFNLSAHLPWIGMRTNQIDSAHVELLRGIENPIGVKIGLQTDSQHLIELCRTLNPGNEPGKIVLIHRFGVNHIANGLPRLIETVQKLKANVVWCVDPMHGNTESTSNGYKTRRFENICREVELAFRLHQQHNSLLGGVHLELTGENVTECLGGARALKEQDLVRAYRSQVDPRLNYEQALELAFSIKDFYNSKLSALSNAC